ncbi:hypothetical protein HHL19_27490 [Streptomyces sp. R302]|uniref:hypothetical protein n=1 Tax=unclassified Streptomyces TaxID=2593676 RepID=UPI00145E8407|nr:MULTISPECIES: hypothetical protein [unclassified Streptomyces]NML52238.1 hypothetical protein [Streptomyces sp. R301]NML82296.1 hypothetical protein [Streptomyces sp. R302]
MARALDRQDTAEALERYRRRAGRWAGAGLGALLLVPVAVLLPGTVWAEDVAPVLGGGGLVLLAFGLGALRLARRMRRALSAGDWSAHAAEPVARTLHAATVVLAAPGAGELWPLTVVAVQQRYHLAQPGPDGVLWWCGDPHRGGVLAASGGGELIWARPVRGRRARQRIVRKAEREGLLNRPVPRQPPGAAAPARAAAPAPVRRRWGLWRWVVLVAGVALGLGIYGVEASDRDPQIDLTVLSEEADGSCVVRWTDPWDRRDRTGPYRCDPERSSLLSDWETGWIVSYGPWKGDLYNADWWGTPANDVNDAVGVLGLLGLPVGLVGGAVGRWRRRPVAPVPYRATGGTQRVSLVKARPGTYTYAGLAAEAERRAVPQTRPPRPEADVREVPWWRVRSLRAMTSVHELLFGLIGCVAFGLVALAGPEDVSTVQIYGFGGLVVASVLFHGFRLLTVGRPIALLFARAAKAPVAVPKRYVLLPDPYGGLPVLVLFPAHGGPDDRPEALLPLLPPGPAKRPWQGLPSASAGTADLRGWLDRSDDGGPVVVARIEGRTYWPAEPYLESGEGDAVAFFERLGADGQAEALSSD